MKFEMQSLKVIWLLFAFRGTFNKQRGYRHEELKIALEKVDSLPDGEIFIIPARLEKCDLPNSLSHLHRVDLFEADGYKKLMRALRKHIASM